MSASPEGKSKGKSSPPGNIGIDIGTMNLVAAKTENEQTSVTRLRNVFLEVAPKDIGTINMDYVSHVELDNKIYILSEDAYNFANIFGKQVNRPMYRGMVSPNEIDSVDILAIMVKELMGQGNGKASCCYSVPANPVDSEKNIIYHEHVFERIINQLGYKPISLNEGVAVVYAECGENDFTGIGISFGAGMTNVAVVYKSVPTLTFSLSRGGDWIDENAAMSIGSVANRMTALKERDDFDLTDFTLGNKKERRMREALIYYYKSLIEYTMNHIVSELNKSTTEFLTDIPVVVSGGTSQANGFIETVSQIFETYELPFTISEIRTAANPLTAVAEGCLIRSNS